MWNPLALYSQNHKLARLPLCPLPQLLDLSAAKRVLAFVPHPDDEAIGCGGTLALLASRCPVMVVLVTDGGGAGGLPPDAAARRHDEFAHSLQTLGVADFVCLNETDGALQDSPALRNKFAAILQDFRPNWVMLPSPLDYHRDHVRLAVMLQALCQQQDGIDLLLHFEVWSPVPATHVVDISTVIEKKQAALACHVTALGCGDYLHASIGLAAYRSMFLPFGGEKSRYAEGFLVTPPQQGDLFRRALHIGLALIGRLG